MSNPLFKSSKDSLLEIGGGSPIMNDLMQDEQPDENFSTYNYEDCVGEARKLYLENKCIDEQIKMWKVV